MSSDSTNSIDTIEINQRMSSVRLKAVRLGHEIACGSNSSTRIKKMIMMDCKGVIIGVIMFNEDIDTHARKFELNKTYLISNADVRKVDQRYPSIHSEKELTLKRYTVVNETFESIDIEIQHNFVDFKDIDSEFSKDGGIDVYGTLAQVGESKLVSVKSPTNLKSVRDITIVNNSIFMVVSLWDDMAIHEGDRLKKLVGQNPIVTISNVTPKKVLGRWQLQSIFKSILQISPELEEMFMVQRPFENYAPLKIAESIMIQKMTQAKEVTLKDLTENQHELSKESYYCFMGIVDGIQNKSTIWYDSCKKCSTSCPKNAGITTCRKCNEEVIQTTPRYRITLNVVQGDYNAHITMFDEVAAVYVGCLVDEYISSINEGENESPYYRGLSSQISTEVRFMTTVKYATFDRKGNLTLIANGIQKIQSSPTNEEISTAPIHEPQTNKGGEKKKSNKRVKPPKVVEKKKSKKGVKQTQVEEKTQSSIELQLHEVQGKRKRRIPKKYQDFEDCIDIPSDSDDDLPLDKLISKNKKKKEYTLPIKVKQEKI